MANELTVIPANVPAHVSALFATLSGINKDATDGISPAMYPIIKTSSTRFVLSKDGEEKQLKSLELKIVVLRAKPGFEKRYYAKKFDPNNSEITPPDCFSHNGVTPEPGCINQQNASCAGCKQNMFGTGTDATGAPGKGKACSDRKLLAVLYPNPDTKALEIYGFSLPPASLKAFSAYVGTLTANNIPLPAAFTTVGFDEKSSYPILTFSYGGLMGEAELAKVIPMIESAEVKTIIETAPGAVTTVPHKPGSDTTGIGAGGFGFTPEPEKAKKAPKAEKASKAAEPAPVVAAEDEDDVSDADLAGLLGISL